MAVSHMEIYVFLTLLLLIPLESAKRLKWRERMRANMKKVLCIYTGYVNLNKIYCVFFHISLLSGHSD